MAVVIRVFLRDDSAVFITASSHGMREERRMAENSISHPLNYVRFSPSSAKHLAGSTFPPVRACTPQRWFIFAHFVC